MERRFLFTFRAASVWKAVGPRSPQLPALLGFQGYLTLDSDVCCVGDFDATTFVLGGRGLSRWEPKRHHDWWRNAAEVVGSSYDARGYGLSVAPNLLHGTLAAQTPRGIGSLVSWKLRKPGSVPWTEYSLYTSVAELKGTLLDYHVDWDTCYAADVHLFSEQSCVWDPDDFERLVKLPKGSDPGGKFVIVQSHARIPPERVRGYCLSFAG